MTDDSPIVILIWVKDERALGALRRPRLARSYSGRNHVKHIGGFSHVNESLLRITGRVFAFRPVSVTIVVIRRASVTTA